MERLYKEKLGRKDISWTDMFFISDYKDIIKKYWNNTPDPEPKDFRRFEEDFAIDAGFGFHSKDDKIRWISVFNSYRNLLAHEGSKDKGLNKMEVSFLFKLYEHFFD